MKKSYIFILLVLTAATVQSQALLEVNGTVPMSLNSRSFFSGGGAGFAIYGAPINLGNRNGIIGRSSPVELRFGGGFYGNGTGSRTFGDVPLLSGAGNASVDFQNTLWGMNTGVKLSTETFGGAIHPYAEAFVGIRYFGSEMTVDPIDSEEKSSSMTLAKSAGVNFGATGGAMIRLTEGFFIDTGVMWSHSDVTGEFVEIGTLKRIGDNIGYHTEKLPTDFLMFKLGVTGYIGEMECNGHGGELFFDILDGILDGLGNCGGGGGGGVGLIKF